MRFRRYVETSKVILSVGKDFFRASGGLQPAGASRTVSYLASDQRATDTRRESNMGLKRNREIFDEISPVPSLYFSFDERADIAIEMEVAEVLRLRDPS